MEAHQSKGKAVDEEVLPYYMLTNLKVTGILTLKSHLAQKLTGQVYIGMGV